jgi:VWFA-related protein
MTPFGIFVAGALLAATLCAQENPVFRASAHLVEIHASISGRNGEPIRGLTADRFTVLDNGSRQRITVFESDAEGISCALLLDTTGSMNDALPMLKYSVNRFIDALRPGDAASLYSFNVRLHRLHDLTSDLRTLKQSVLRLRAHGMTALFDAIAQVARDIEPLAGKKAIVVFTDGDDNASGLNTRSAINRARLTGVPIYSIAQGDAARVRKLMAVLDDIAAGTGGLSFRVKSRKSLSDAFDQIASNLRSTYLLAYPLPPEPAPGWHEIRLQVADMRNVRIRSKQGYQIDD